MYFKRIDPDSPASRGDLEALLEAMAHCAELQGELSRHFAEFIDGPFETRLKILLMSANRFRAAYLTLRKVEESISPTPREGA